MEKGGRDGKALHRKAKSVESRLWWYTYPYTYYSYIVIDIDVYIEISPKVTIFGWWF